MKAASLNHVYRLVWSKIQQAWVAVAEGTRTSGKSSLNGQVNHSKESGNCRSLRDISFTPDTKWRVVIASAFAAVCMPMASFADTNVVAGVVAGDLAIKDISATHTQYTHTANVNIVDFYKFGVLEGHQLDVVMPDAGRALYRVLGNSASEVLGKLNSNGSLFLINQNGVLFGPNAQVNVGNIVASTLNISNDDFLQGRYHFKGGDNAGSVVNHGVIKTKDEGYIVMLGKTVENTGTLVASNGSVVMAAAKEAVLDFYGNGLVRANLTAQAVEGIVKNSGLIQTGLVQLATNARSAAINVSGIIEANQLVERDGVIRLEGGDNAKVQVSGKLLAKGENTTGGTIEVTGEQVALLKGALLDASGDKGGGTVLVGGDYQGQNENVYNARTTYVDQGATIKADALQEGNGGKVVVWANDLTRYYGAISAQGGVLHGNGGFVEVSGKQNLGFDGVVNVAASNGLGGMVLLDPENITLSNDPQAPLPDQAAGTPDIAFADNPGATTNVNVTSVSGFSELFLQATNNITVTDALTMTGLVGDIRLDAGNDINVNANVKAGTFGSVKMNATNDININADLTSGLIGTVNLDAGNNIAIDGNITGSGGVTLSATTITRNTATNININTTGNTLLGYAGDVTINATGDVNLGNANINATGTTVAGASGARGGKVDIQANSFTMNGNIDTSGSASALNTGVGGEGGAVVINTAANSSVGNITTRSGDAGVGSTTSARSGEVTVTSTTGSVSTGNIDSSGGVNNFGANVALNAAGSVTTGDVNTSAGVSRSNTDGKSAGEVKVSAGTSLIVGNIIASGGDGSGNNKSGGAAGAVNLVATAGNLSMGAVTNIAGTATGTGVAGPTAKVLASAGSNLELNGDINTSSPANDAVQLVAVGNFKNNTDASITTGTNGNWTIYSADPTGDVKGTKLLAAYDYKQYGTKFGGPLLGTGNGFVHAVSPTVTATLTGTATKGFDGNNVVTDLSGLSVTTSGVLDGDKVIITPTPITAATYDNAAVGTGKSIGSTYNVTSITTNEGKQIFNPTAGSFDGYTVVTNSTATGTISPLPAPVTALGFASPRDDAGLGGLIPNNPALNTMFIVSLNPAAGDEEDLDAVACPTNEDSLGSTPILNSGVKLPDGVSSNCI